MFAWWEFIRNSSIYAMASKRNANKLGWFCADSFELRYHFADTVLQLVRSPNNILITFYGPRGFTTTCKHSARNCSFWSGPTQIIICVKICGQTSFRRLTESQLTSCTSVGLGWGFQDGFDLAKPLSRVFMAFCVWFGLCGSLCGTVGYLGIRSLCECRAAVRWFWDDSDLLSKGLSPDEQQCFNMDRIWCGWECMCGINQWWMGFCWWQEICLQHYFNYGKYFK